MLPKGQRLADDNIYLQEDRFHKPKEIHKLIAQRILALHGAEGALDIIDVGCATGELLFHLAQVLGKNHKFSGADVSSKMLTVAKTMLPAAEFIELDIAADTVKFARAYDVVICCGVLEIFDDITTPLTNLLRLCRHGGVVLAFTNINDANIDLVSRYRNGGGTGTWQSGWNIFSKRTIETIVSGVAKGCRINFTDFEMPFDIPMNIDPMRNWTVSIAGKRLTTNGSGLLVRENLIEIFT